MNKLLLLLYIGVLGIWLPSFAEMVHGPQISVLQDQGSSTTIEFQLRGYSIDLVEIDGKTYSKIVVPGQVTYLEKGLPELPTIARNIIIPDNALMDYRVVDMEYETKRVNTIVPSKGSISRKIDPRTVPYTFDNFYESDSWWPQKTIELTEPFILRDFRGITIRFNPFQYNPARNELKVVKKIVVEVYEKSSGGANPLVRKKDVITREFVNIYRSTFLNFNRARYDSISEGAGRMVIICADAYMSNMEEFKTWKRKKGIETKMVPVSAIGNTEPNIKTFIQNEYDAGDLVWILFVGDGDEVEPATGTVGWAAGAAADPVYAYTAGSDYYPDIFISRFSSRGGDYINVDKQVNRSIAYETTPQTGADWYHVGLGVASAQGDPADSTRCNWLRDSLLAYHYTEVNKSYDYWGTTAIIKGFIEDGTSIINYIGHGSTYGWGNGGGFGVSDLNDLENAWMLPFVTSVACDVGNFDGHDCYCEVSVTAGTVEEPDGFVAHWGSSISQRWEEPCIGQETTVNLMTHDRKNTVGGLCFNGSSRMIEFYGGADNAVDMAQTWTIFGDASLQLRTNTPEVMTVNHLPSIFVGQTTFDVNVPGVEDALVGLYIDTLLVGHGYTDASGNVTVTIDPVPTGPGTMYVTVTAYNKIPSLGSVPVVVPTGPYIVLGSLVIDDAGGDGQVNPGEMIDLGIWAHNVGVQAAFDVYGLLSTADPYVLFSTDSSWYGYIPAADSSLSNPPYRFTVVDSCPNNHSIQFTLEFHDGNDSIWTAHPSVTVYAPVLVYQEVSVVNDDNGNGLLDPGETADLVVTIKNEGGATAADVHSQLMTSSSDITINDDSGDFGTIDPGNQAANSGDPYTVTLASGVATGTIIDFEIEVVSGVYRDTLGFGLVVGKKHYYLWNADPTSQPGLNIDSILTARGYSGDYGTSLAQDLTTYQAVFVCVGIFPNKYSIGDASPEAARLVDYLENHDGRLYLEGGDVWYYDPTYQNGYDFCPLFGITALDDGSNDVGPVVGENGAFTEGMNFTYSGENNYMDHIEPQPASGAFLIFHDGDDYYDCGVARDEGDFRTVGNAFELGLLDDGAQPSTRAVLLDSIMRFFGVGSPPGVEEEVSITGFPRKTALCALFPNPCVRTMRISYQMAHRSKVSLCLYDAAGRLVRTLAQGSSEPGYYNIIWNTKDNQGRAVPAGVYFIRFETDNYKKVAKSILLK